MARQMLSQCAVIAVVLFYACDDGENEARKMIAAQNEANRRLAAVAAEANQKAQQAQLDADLGNFFKARENYRSIVKSNLSDLDRSVAELENQAKVAPAKTRDEIFNLLRQVRSRRETYANNLNSLEAESAASWEAAKARMDKEWSALQQLIETD